LVETSTHGDWCLPAPERDGNPGVGFMQGVQGTVKNLFNDYHAAVQGMLAGLTAGLPLDREP